LAFDYSGLAETARGLLYEYGQDITFTRQGSAVYDNETGQVTSTETTFNAKGVIFPYKNGVSQVNGSLIEKDDQEVYWQGNTAPIPGDTVVVANVAYKVVSVMAIEPAGINVLYQLQVRR
jgi:hypothetical protein